MRETTRLIRETPLGRNFILRDQMYRACLSIMLNIAEGSGRRSNKEFNQFLAIAHGSVKEFQCILYVAIDSGNITQPQLDALYSAADEIGRMIYGLSKYLRSA